jgi:hypothetical protein
VAESVAVSVSVTAPVLPWTGDGAAVLGRVNPLRLRLRPLGGCGVDPTCARRRWGAVRIGKGDSMSLENYRETLVMVREMYEVPTLWKLTH